MTSVIHPLDPVYQREPWPQYRLIPTTIYDDNNIELGCTISFVYTDNGSERRVLRFHYKVFDPYEAPEEVILEQVKDEIIKNSLGKTVIFE